MYYFLICGRFIGSADYDTGKLKLKYDKAFAKSCVDFYQSLTANKNVHLPPLMRPPLEYLQEFKDAEIPVVKYVYHDDTRSANVSTPMTLKEFKMLSYRLSDLSFMGVGPRELKELVQKYDKRLIKHNSLVLGAEIPWLESFVYYMMGIKRVTTLDYVTSDKQIPDKAHFETFLFDTFLARAIKQSLVNHYDFAISYSAVQQAGLGN